MNRTCILGSIAKLAAAILFSFVVTGCAEVKERGRLIARSTDLGMTFSLRPQFAGYFCGAGLFSLGYGQVEGTFIGLGDGGVGAMHHFARGSGVLFSGQEDVSWGDTGTTKSYSVGVLGLLKSGGGADSESTQCKFGSCETPQEGKTFRFSCNHYLHLGCIGWVANEHWGDLVKAFAPWGIAPAAVEPAPAKPNFTIPSPFHITAQTERSPAAPSPPKVAARVEARPPASPPREIPRTYRVSARDTFCSIARSVYGNASDWRRLYDANKQRLHLSSPQGLRAGMRLQVPAVAQSAGSDETTRVAMQSRR